MNFNEEGCLGEDLDVHFTLAHRQCVARRIDFGHDAAHRVVAEISSISHFNLSFYFHKIANSIITSQLFSHNHKSYMLK